MKKLLALATLVIFSSFFAPPSVVWAELDCKWEQVKEKDGIAWKCVGKDCEKCVKDIESKAGQKFCICRCEGNGWPICRGQCCSDLIRDFSPIQKPRQ